MGWLVGLEKSLLFFPHLGTRKITEKNHTTWQECECRDKQQTRSPGKKLCSQGQKITTTINEKSRLASVYPCPKTTRTRFLSWCLALLSASFSCLRTTAAASTKKNVCVPLNAKSATSILTRHQTTHVLTRRKAERLTSHALSLSSVHAGGKTANSWIQKHDKETHPRFPIPPHPEGEILNRTTHLPFLFVEPLLALLLDLLHVGAGRLIRLIMDCLDR